MKKTDRRAIVDEIEWHEDAMIEEIHNHLKVEFEEGHYHEEQMLREMKMQDEAGYDAHITPPSINQQNQSVTIEACHA